MPSRAAACLIATGLLAAGGRAAHGDWRFTPKSSAEAAVVTASGFYPTSILQLRSSYLDIREGGRAVTLGMRVVMPMPYLLIPGIRVPGVFSGVRVDVPVIDLSTPQVGATGLGDIHVIDGAIKRLGWGAIGLGVAAVLPAATDPLLGGGQLLLGPGLGAATKFMQDAVSMTVLVENLVSVDGDDARPQVNVLLVQPSVAWHLRPSMYLEVDPVMRFDWMRGGRATVPINLAIGVALSRCFVVELQPEWTVTGNGKHDVLVRLSLTQLGW